MAIRHLNKSISILWEVLQGLGALFRSVRSLYDPSKSDCSQCMLDTGRAALCQRLCSLFPWTEFLSCFGCFLDASPGEVFRATSQWEETPRKTLEGLAWECLLHAPPRWLSSSHYPRKVCPGRTMEKTHFGLSYLRSRSSSVITHKWR